MISTRRFKSQQSTLFALAFMAFLFGGCAQIELFQPISDETTQSTDPAPSEDDEGAPPPVSNLLYSENFEGFALGTDPVNWLGTGANNSQTAAPNLFTVLAPGTQALCTNSDGANIHSHLIVANNWRDFEFSGRMGVNADGGIGVTFYSDYNNTDSYYRLRRSPNVNPNSFHFSHHPNGTLPCNGNIDTGVALTPNAFQRFKIRVTQLVGSTNMKAKVWADGNVEPVNFQADCTEPTGAYTGGRIGLWATGAGTKCWDDIEVRTF